MTEISNGTITITDLTDITDIYFEYGLAVIGAHVDDPNNEYTFSQAGELSWEENYSETGKPIVPQWIPGYEIWKREVKVEEGVASPKYGTPFLDTALNQINTSIEEIQTNARYFVRNSTGSIVIAGNDEPFDSTDISTYGFNNLNSPAGIDLRYNNIVLSKWNNTALTFYQPPTINGSTITQGKKTIELGNSALTFYNPSNGITKKIALDEDGLLIYDSNGQNAIAQYGSSAIIGNKDGNHIEISGEGFGIYRDKNNKVAYINGDQLVIPKTVVLNEMNVGNEDDGLGQWSWTVHKVTIGNEQKYNLCLKWLE